MRPHPEGQRARVWRTPMTQRRLAGIVLVMGLAAGLAIARLYHAQLSALASAAAQGMAVWGVTGWFLAACLQILIALCGVLPASVGGFAMGMAYGIPMGFLLSAIATIIGAVLAFLLPRGLFRPWVQSWVSRHPRVARLDDAVSRDGWRLVALMRLSPVVPFAMTSYALGLTSLTLRAYVIGTLASLPALLGYVALGHLAKIGVFSLSDGQAGPWRWAVLCFAIGVTALLTFRLAAILRLVMRLPDTAAAPVANSQALAPEIGVTR